MSCRADLSTADVAGSSCCSSALPSLLKDAMMLPGLRLSASIYFFSQEISLLLNHHNIDRMAFNYMTLLFYDLFFSPHKYSAILTDLVYGYINSVLGIPTLHL